jgi:RimJ/RimL family protein N-acetyltransferase
MKVLETDRLVVRHMTVDDAGFMLRLLNEPSWLQFIGDRGVKTVEDARQYILHGPIEMVARLGFGFYVVSLKSDGQAVGICGLAKRDYLDDVDIGYALLPEYNGCGYAHEAAAAVLAYARSTLSLKRVAATTRSHNYPSAKLLAKLGLRLEKTIKHPEDGRELQLYAIVFGNQSP